MPTAGMLLAAILSDTLNLESPTTTDADRTMLAVLARYCAVDDVTKLATTQFKAKSQELGLMSANGLVTGDCKSFKLAGAGFGGTVGFGVIETVDAEAVLARRDELIEEMRAVKQERGLAMIFLAIVCIFPKDAMHSDLLVPGPVEAALAAAAFQKEAGAVSPRDGGGVVDLGGMVSRKKDFVPALTEAVSAGWAPPQLSEEQKKQTADVDLGEKVVEEVQGAKVVRRRASVAIVPPPVG